MSAKPLLFDPDDPRLTAYALGELTDAAERAEVERLLAESAEARAEVAEIRALTAALTAEYDQERAVAAEAAAPAAEAAPTNVVALPSGHRVRSWVGATLKIAAALLVLAFLASLAMPVFNSVGPRGRARLHAMAAAPAERPQPQTVLPTNETQELKYAGSSKPSSQTAQPPAVAAPLLAQNQVQLSLDTLKREQNETPYPAQNPPLFSGPVGLEGARAQPETASLLDPLPLNEVESLPGSQLAMTLKESSPQIRTESDSNYWDAKDVKPIAGTGFGAFGGGAPAEPSKNGSYPTNGKPMPAPAAAPAARAGKLEDLVALRAPLADINPEAVTQETARRDKDASQTVTTFALRRNQAQAEALRRRIIELNEKMASTALTVTPKPDPVVERDALIQELRKIEASSYNTATYDHLVENPFLAAKDNPLSTFSIDVDTASYANVRRFIESGSLPPPDAVRIEELLNYFPYHDAPPAPGSDKPFAVHLEAAACPWEPDHRLVRIGIKGRELAEGKRPASNLVFLVDVSGSMEPAERLPLIKESLRLLVAQLTESDHVAIVTYAGNSGLALPSTGGERKDAILRALDHLEAGGSTNGASGIELAYKVAQENFIKGGVNRVILATDGDFNVGVTNQGNLVRLIEEKAKSGVFLSALGVGTDNYKDSTMQKLADKGNGNYHYIDRIEEGRKVLVEQMSGTLVTIAKDVKIQVEFNPAAVSAYRLIGYEKRMLRKEDFNNDKIDAGEIGAGHSVTALYEVVPIGQPTPGEPPAVDALKYQSSPAAESEKSAPAAPATRQSANHEMLTVKMRHKAPDADQSERTYEVPLIDRGASGDFANASADFKFSAAVASFGLVLRDSPYKGNATLGAAMEMAQEGKGADESGLRAGFIDLARKAQELKDARR